jgi:hypothetical protein
MCACRINSSSDRAMFSRWRDVVMFHRHVKIFISRAVPLMRGNGKHGKYKGKYPFLNGNGMDLPDSGYR